MERLDKVISNQTGYSRKDIKELIRKKRVTVNNEIAAKPELKVDPAIDRISVDGQEISVQKFVYLMLNKPRGYVTTLSDEKGRKTVADLVAKEHPELELKTARAEGLRDCRKLMAMAKAGKYKGYLLEGMACPGGCVAGAGTLLPVELAARVVGNYQKEADTESQMESPYRDQATTLD